MTVQKATVRVNPTRTDTVRLAGSLPGISLDGAESIRVALDGVAFEVPVAAFTRKRRQLRYRATSDEPGISSLRIDLPEIDLFVSPTPDNVERLRRALGRVWKESGDRRNPR